MVLLRSTLFFLLYAISSVGPGLLLVRRMRWRPAEKLCVAVAMSSLLVYAGSFAIFIVHADVRWHFALAGIFLAMTLTCWRDLRWMVRDKATRGILIGYLALLVWGMMCLGLVRSYSGASYANDWVEHYQRAQFYLNRPPLETLFVNRYLLPARPPLMNVVAAYYMAMLGQHFYLFQLACMCLNLQALFAGALLVRTLGRRAKGAMAVLVVAMMFNPMIMENCTYSWTKMMTAGYVVMGIALYCVGWRKNDSSRIIAAFAVLATASLIHYSAGPFVLFVGVHYAVYQFWARRARWREGIAAIGVSAAILATWFVWSWASYGARVTFKGNPTIEESAHFSAAGNVWKACQNFYTTLVPFPLRGGSALMYTPGNIVGPQGAYAHFRDYMFILYEANVIPAMGIVGGWVVLFLFWCRLRRRDWKLAAERWFWLLLVVVCTPVAISTFGTGASNWGIAPVVLQPVVLLGVFFLAGQFGGLSKGMRVAVAIGWSVDFFLGILIHFDVQNVVFEAVRTADGKVTYTSPIMLSWNALGNWYAKTQLGLVFLGDPLAPYAGALRAGLLAGFAVSLCALFTAARSSRRAPKPASIVEAIR